MRKLEDVRKVQFRTSLERPPNFEEIAKHLPGARKYGVIFTVGDTVYNPSRVNLTFPLMVHEATHVLQQTVDMTAEQWWETYLHNKYFRFEQELEAHQMELAMAEALGLNRHFRRATEKQLARRLSGPLYGGYKYDYTLSRLKEADDQGGRAGPGGEPEGQDRRDQSAG